MINSFVGNGRTTKEVELRYSTTGMAIGNFVIAIDRGLSKEKKQQAEANNQPTTDFLRVVCFGGTAEFVANHLGKGKLVGVQGKVQTGSYEKDGVRIYTTEILANSIDILEWVDKENNQPTKDFTESDESIPF